MEMRFDPGVQGRRSRSLRSLAVAVACVAAFTGHALAETTAPDAASEATAEAAAQPKWACDQQTVAVDPVWRGKSSLTFPFEIRNEGTADLKINAKGG